MEQVKTVCLHKNLCVSLNAPRHTECPDCRALLSTGEIITVLMQRVAALERAVEYFEKREFERIGH